MAVHTVRLPATQLHNGISGNLSPTNHNPNSVIRSTNHCCFISVLTTLEEGD
ncbi:hypothetical protein YC2023_092696 [Brassica napus]